MSEYPAHSEHPRTAEELRHLDTRNLVRHEVPIPAYQCTSPGLRTDILRSAQRNADATGVVQQILYGEPVRVRIDREGYDSEPLYASVTTTWVLPNFKVRSCLSGNLPPTVVFEPGALEAMIDRAHDKVLKQEGMSRP